MKCAFNLQNEKKKKVEMYLRVDVLWSNGVALLLWALLLLQATREILNLGGDRKLSYDIQGWEQVCQRHISLQIAGEVKVCHWWGHDCQQTYLSSSPVPVAGLGSRNVKVNQTKLLFSRIPESSVKRRVCIGEGK